MNIRFDLDVDRVILMYVMTMTSLRVRDYHHLLDRTSDLGLPANFFNQIIEGDIHCS